MNMSRAGTGGDVKSGGPLRQFLPIKPPKFFYMAKILLPGLLADGLVGKVKF